MTITFEERETLMKLRALAKKHHVSVGTMIRRILKKLMEMEERGELQEKSN